ncbi:ATP-binding cassette domain-containing protein [Paludibacterium yongneupense]|uniref:ATP-binding cassette domain-containing protein n=1 Tax=Paludibacterium yongneupense TaxID=400061 RepID=UPI0003FA9D68|nr:ATP-binding cassette domain-containing protein [Paludibacterium yongneupense]
MDAPLLTVRDFGKRYGGSDAVCGLSLDIARGELFGLIGPDGAGKSSFMKAVAGVLRFDAGRVQVFGTDIASDTGAESVKSRLGLMPQGLGQNLYGSLSVEENIDFFARLRMVPRDQAERRKHDLLAVTRLAPFAQRPMRQLSGGMKQKLGLACTLIHAPDLIILDEPTTGVDPVSRRDFWGILGDLMESEGLTALVSTAYLDEASRFTRLCLLHQGRALATGTPDEILARAPGAVVQCRVVPQLEAQQRLAPHFPHCEAMGQTLRLFVEGLDREAAGAAVRESLNGLDIETLDTMAPELEDVFLALLGGERAATLPPGQANTPSADEPDAILAQGLTRTFGEFVAVADVSFKVRPGEIFGLLGANGAGKTTAIKMLTGILPPSGGSGSVAGADMRHAGALIKSRIGYMSQAFSLYLDLTVRENIRLYAGLYGLGRQDGDERMRWIIGMAGLAGHEDELAASLPMGLRQRLALGCALVHRPRVLFLDEPTSGVDPLGRRVFWDILFSLSRVDGVAMLVTTHFMSEAEHCDRLALMFAGRIVADASPQELKRQVVAEAGELYQVTTADARGLGKALAASGFPGASPCGRDLRLLSRDGAALAAAVSAHEAGARVETRPIGMEDVFVHLVSRLEAEHGGAA